MKYEDGKNRILRRSRILKMRDPMKVLTVVGLVVLVAALGASAEENDKERSERSASNEGRTII